jgi:hypothetical protein
MSCGCCGGPSVQGFSSVTTGKYSPTGWPIWWADSQVNLNHGCLLGDYYYEISRNTVGANATIRRLGVSNGIELARRDFGETAATVFAVGDNLYASADAKFWRLDPLTMATIWSISQAIRTTTTTTYLMQDDTCVLPIGGVGTEQWRMFDAGVTQWTIDNDDPGVGTGINIFTGIDTSGRLIAGGLSGLNGRMWRYDASGSLIDTFVPSVADGGTSRVYLHKDGDKYWYCSGGGSIFLVNGSLGEVFAPVDLAVAVQLADARFGPLYFTDTRSIYRVSEAGVGENKHDEGVANTINGFKVQIEGSRFAFFRPTSPTVTNMEGYSDTGTPATLDWTIAPTFTVGSQIILSAFQTTSNMHTDTEGNIYVTSGRTALSALDSAPA